MALLPCEATSHRYLGPGNRAYIAILDGVQKWEHKPRLCPDHLGDLEELFSRVNGLVDDSAGSDYHSQHCLVCVQSVDGQQPQSVFMTVFAGRGERRDYFAPVCRACRSAAESLLRAPWEDD